MLKRFHFSYTKGKKNPLFSFKYYNYLNFSTQSYQFLQFTFSAELLNPSQDVPVLFSYVRKVSLWGRKKR